MLNRLVLLAICALLPISAHATTPKSYLGDRPRLVVLLVIDQFRADYITRFHAKFGKDGFNRLLSKGAYLPWAQYGILHSMTGPGHATLVTGAYPYQMGIPMNTWYDTARDTPVYCVEGGSPQYLVGSTFGDELKAGNPLSKVVAVSLKDRAAILTGGRQADAAIWFDDQAFQWTSSKHYLRDGKLPAWVAAANAELHVPSPESFRAPQSRYTPVSGNKAVYYLPYGLDLTEEMAERAISANSLGQDRVTDFLAVSFSPHDLVGHAFGPESPEIEKMTLAEDRVLARFFKFIDRAVPGGMKNVVIALSADHGIPPNPDVVAPKGLDAGRVDEAKLTAWISKRLDDRFGKPSGRWIPAVTDLNFWVNRDAVRERGADLRAVLAEVADELRQAPGIAQVFTLSDYREGRLPPGAFRNLVERSYIPGRSGDVVAIPKPFYFPLDKEAVTHMTNYSYDRTVPLILAGPRIKKGVYSTQVFTIDLAPTLSFLSAVLPPSGSEGRVLSEIIE